MRKDKLKQRSMKAGSICQSATPHVSPRLSKRHLARYRFGIVCQSLMPHVSPRPPRVGAYKTTNTPPGVYLKAPSRVIKKL